MITFSTTYSKHVKVKGHHCVGFLREPNKLEVYYNGVKATIKIDNTENTFSIDEKEFEMLMLNAVKETKKELRKTKNKR